MFILCKKHNIAENVTVSIGIRNSMVKGIFDDEITTITIVNPDENMKKNYILVDSDFLRSFGIKKEEEIILYDRDKKNKRMNDRLLINRLSHQICNVCPQCLSEKLDISVNRNI